MPLDDPLHAHSGPSITWTTTNSGEALTGVQTPLTWTWWEDGVELGMRQCFFLLGALKREEIFASTNADDRYATLFFGRFSANINRMRAIGDRMPGTDGDGVEEQILGGLHSGLPNRNSNERLPVMAWKLPTLIYRLPTVLSGLRNQTEGWWKANTAPNVLADVAGAPGRMAEARRRFMEIMGPHAAATMICQAMYDQVVGVAEAAGLKGLETSLVTGYGGFEEGKIAEHLWDVSRGRLTVEQFIAAHGYHGPHEGTLSSHSWREDPEPIKRLAETYRTMDEAASPARVSAARVRDREANEARLLAATPPLRRGGAKLVLKLAKRQIPLREIGKAAFLQAIDVARAAGRTIGTDLAAQGTIDDPDDIQYVTFQEIVAGDYTDVRAKVGARRAKRAEYIQLRMPDIWTGPPEAVAEHDLPAAQPDEIAAMPVAPGVVQARARVVLDPEAGIEIEPGEVLVCETTDPSWASYFLVASALVIDIGGVISHGAIVARELGVPCVINTRIGTRAINTGDLLHVDGNTGVVKVLERA